MELSIGSLGKWVFYVHQGVPRRGKIVGVFLEGDSILVKVDEGNIPFMKSPSELVLDSTIGGQSPE